MAVRRGTEGRYVDLLSTSIVPEMGRNGLAFCIYPVISITYKLVVECIGRDFEIIFSEAENCPVATKGTVLSFEECRGPGRDARLLRKS